MKTHHLLTAVMLMTWSFLAHAENDLANCLWFNGTAMTERECRDARERRTLLEQAIKKDRLARQEQERVQKENREFVKQWLAKGGKKEDLCGVARTISGRMTWLQEPCAQHETPAGCTRQWTDERGSLHIQSRPCGPGEQKTIQQIQREEETAQKKKCGKDFQAMRIGMSLERYEQCTEALDFVTETVSKNGVVETYRGMFWLIHVQNGKIISYTRR